jgi:Ca-activated chloride channel family protein
VRPSVEELTIQLKRDREAAPSPPLIAPQADQPPSQNTAGKGEEDKAFTLSVAVEEVLLNVSVEDASGKPVTDLQREDFTVFQDGVQQEIRSFGHENVPLSAVLLMDVSSSMQGSPMVEAKVAALAFLGQSQPQDAVSLVAFNDKVEVVRPFTQDMLQVRTGIHSLTASGGTALYDAISKSTELMQKAPHPRHAIILLSDGKDEDSVVKFSAVDRTVQASDVVIFSIGEYAELDRKLFMTEKKYYKQPEYDVNLNPVWVLRSFAELSGGRAFFPKLGDPLEPFFTQIARELHQQYVVTYRPTSTAGQGNFHRIDVKVSSPKHPAPLKVRTRKGFLSQ